MKDLFGNEVIRSMGLYQPYATAMLHGKIESRWVQRGKKPPFPLGKYLLYSTKKPYSLQGFKHVAGEFAAGMIKLIEHDETNWLNGHALMIGDLVKVEPLLGSETPRAFVDIDTEGLLGEMTGGPHLEFNFRVLQGLHFKNIQRIKPFPFKGKQGVGILTAEEKNKIQFV